MLLLVWSGISVNVPLDNTTSVVLCLTVAAVICKIITKKKNFSMSLVWWKICERKHKHKSKMQKYLFVCVCTRQWQTVNFIGNIKIAKKNWFYNEWEQWKTKQIKKILKAKTHHTPRSLAFCFHPCLLFVWFFFSCVVLYPARRDLPNPTSVYASVSVSAAVVKPLRLIEQQLGVSLQWDFLWSKLYIIVVKQSVC